MSMAAVTVVRKKSYLARPGTKFQFDYWLLLATGALVVLGMLMVYSTTFDYGLRFFEDAPYYFRRQFIALVIGVAVAAMVLQFDYQALRHISVPFLVLTLLLLLFTLFGGELLLGARRGLYEGSYQPSEIAKLATILYIAHWISSKGERIKLLTYGLLPFSVITGVVSALIVRQPDLSTAILIAVVSFTLFFVAGADWRQFALAGALGAAVFFFLITTLPHAAQRMADFQTGIREPMQAGWHVQQSLIALASGGWTGVGLGESTQKFGALPAAHTDGVFAVLGEELGLAGCLIVIGLFGILVWRGVRTAQRARDAYGFLLALGITCWLSFQALINVAVITAVIPFTGIPLPFMSYGGSSMALSLIGVGILLNISRDAARGKAPQPQTMPPRPSLLTPPAVASQTETQRETVDMRRRNGRPHLSGTGRRR
jgi:cell division protein FtsW